jgi:hypothetical protein
MDPSSSIKPPSRTQLDLLDQGKIGIKPAATIMRALLVIALIATLFAGLAYAEWKYRAVSVAFSWLMVHPGITLIALGILVAGVVGIALFLKHQKNREPLTGTLVHSSRAMDLHLLAQTSHPDNSDLARLETELVAAKERLAIAIAAWNRQNEYHENKRRELIQIDEECQRAINSPTYTMTYLGGQMRHTPEIQLLIDKLNFATPIVQSAKSTLDGLTMEKQLLERNVREIEAGITALGGEI